MKKKLLSILLALALCVTLLPTAAWAAAEGETKLTEEILTSGNYTLSNGSYYLDNGVKLPQTLTITGNVTLDLCGMEVRLNSSAEACPVITVANGGHLTLVDKYSTQHTWKYDDANHTWKENNGGTITTNGGHITGGKGRKVSGEYCGGGVYVASGGTFTMENGNIILNSVAKYGGGVYVESGGTFNMSGGSIFANSATSDWSCGGGVYVDGTGTFNMSGNAKIWHNTAQYEGGGVYVAGKNNNTNVTNFTMSGNAAISNNAATQGGACAGGGVCINGGSFSMTGGTIFNNNATSKTLGEVYGGGVYVKESGTFNMSGGTISGNTAKGSDKPGYGGGVAVVSGGSFTMSGTDAKISGNTAEATGYGQYGHGGGVYVSGGTFNMSDSASISGNTATGGGAGVGVTESGTFTMSGSASISGNTAGSGRSGGGVAVSKSTFTMNGGSISGNSATGGGGVYVMAPANGSSVFTMNGGTITGNNSTAQGGGVSMSGENNTSTVTFTMTGGTITGNNCASEKNGGGVYVTCWENASFTVSGSAQVKDNVKGGTKQENATAYTGGTASNVYLLSNNDPNNNLTAIITVGGALTDTATIGVTTATTPNETTTSVQFAAGKSGDTPHTLTVNDKKAFFSDASTEATPYHVKLDRSNNKLSLCSGVEVHTHDWTYTLSEDGKTITATCNGAEATCDFAGNTTLTITAPTQTVYGGDGSAAATLDKTSIGGEDSLPAIQYAKKTDGSYGAATETVPTAAGEYKASITVGNVTANVTYTIAKAAPAAGDFTFTPPQANSLTYDGTAKTATVTSSQDGMGNITVKYFKDGPQLSSAPTDAGTYTFKIDVTEGGNYNSASGLTADSWSFTIAKGNQTITTPTNQTITKGSSNVDISAWATVAGVTGGSNPGALSYALDGTIPNGVTLTDNKLTVPDNVSVNTEIGIQVTAAETANYNKATANFTVTVTDKADAGVTISGAPASTTYGDTFTLTASTADGVPTGGTWSWTTSNSDILEITGGGTTDTVTVRAKKADTNGATLTATYTGDTHYGTATTAAITVAKRTVTVSNITAQYKTYDGTTEAWLNTGFKVFSGKLDGDELEIRVNGTYADANAGEDKTVNLSYELYGAAKANYVLDTTNSQTTATASIGKANLRAEGTGTASGTYGDKLSELTVSGLTAKRGDDVVVAGTWSLSGDAVPNVGDSGTYTATFTPTTGAGNYNPLTKEITLSIAKAAYADQAATGSAKYGSSGTVELSGYVVTGGTLNNIYTTDADTVLTGDVTLSGTALSFTFANDSEKVGKSATVRLTVSSPNYEDYNITVTVTVTDKDVPTVSANDINVTYTGSEIPASAITGTATFNGQNVAGSWSFTNAAPKSVSDSSDSVSVTFTPTDTANFTTVTATIRVTIAKATPTGAPVYTAITASGKTLADAALTTEGGTFSVPGSVKWVDTEGNDLADTTEVAANTAYNWLFTPADSANYNTLTGSVTLWSYTPPIPDIPVIPVIPVIPPAETVTVPVSSDHTTVEVKAEVSEGNATVEVDAAEFEQVAVDGAGSVTLDMSGLKDVNSVTVPAHVVERTNEAENTGLSVALPAGSVALDETALESVAENAGGTDVTISVVSIPTENLSPVVKEIIGMEPTVTAVVDVNILVNGRRQSAFSGGKVTIAIPYTPKPGEDTSKLTVWFIRDDGTVEDKGGYYDADRGCFLFETEHLSRYLLVSVDATFTDVPADAYYAAAVNWAVKQNITGGIGNNLFDPNGSCTRAQIVTFLWRAAGQPVVNYAMPFTDVEEDDYFCEAVRWAAGVGIAKGISETTFGPDETCTRAQAAAFLYRLEQLNGGGFTGAWMFRLPFTDVSEWCYESVAWCYMNGITVGVGNDRFGSHMDCTRAQIVTMLYRLLGE